MRSQKAGLVAAACAVACKARSKVAKPRRTIARPPGSGTVLRVASVKRHKVPSDPTSRRGKSMLAPGGRLRANSRSG